MNREYLESLGLEKEVVDKIMAQHGKTVQANLSELNTTKSELTTIKEQLEERDADIEKLKKVDAEGLQTELQTLQEKYNQDTKELAESIQKAKLDHAIQLKLTQEQARNIKTVLPLLEVDKLELTDEGVKGLDEQILAIKTENEYLFGTAEETRKNSYSFKGNMNGSSGVKMTKDDIMAIKDGTERLAAIQENQDLFK